MTSDAGSGRIRYRHNFQGQLDDTMKYITAMPNKTLVEVLDVVCAKYGQRLDFIAIYSSTWDLENLQESILTFLLLTQLYF